MNIINEEIEKRLYFLNKTINDTCALLKNLPKGRLRISGNNFYMISGAGDNCGKYISRSDTGTIRNLAQADYLREVLRLARKEFQCLSEGRIYTGMHFEEVFDHLNIKRKAFVTAIYLPDELFVKQWLSRQYEKLGFEKDAPEYYSHGHIRLRSKSEVIIVNNFESFCVPFLYEFPLVINGHVFRPDFLTLKMPERKEIYWEHLGLLDVEDYRNKSFLKLNVYAENGIVIGDNLIVTFETSRVPLNTRVIEKIIRTSLI